jgi:hypothetical protein
MPRPLQGAAAAPPATRIRRTVELELPDGGRGQATSPRGLVARSKRSENNCGPAPGRLFSQGNHSHVRPWRGWALGPRGEPAAEFTEPLRESGNGRTGVNV